MRRIVILFLLALFAITGCNNQDASGSIDEIIVNESQKGNFSGCVLVADTQKIYLQKGYGDAIQDLKSNSPETRFRIGSLTKNFTSVLIMKLVESGDIKLSDRISDFIPSYPIDKGSRIMIEHLLSHTSGIPNYTELPEFPLVVNSWKSQQDFISIFSDKELLFEPGTKFSYSNSGYFLLGLIIEKVTELKYEEAVKQMILDPLGMINTGYINNDVRHPNDAQGYMRRGSTLGEPIKFHHLIPFSAGGLYSTTGDLYKFYNALINGNLLTDISINRMFTPYLEQSENKYGFGFGITTVEVESGDGVVNIVGHEGSIPGFMSLVHIVNQMYFIILLDNHESKTLFRLSKIITDQILRSPH